MKVDDVKKELDGIAPPALAADWDNVGLLVGDRNADVKKLMLCIDLTSEVLAEAVAAKAQMVMAYHPVIFKPVSRITSCSNPVVYQAARQGIAVYSTHTALDAAPGGTNDVLADILGIGPRRVLEPLSRSGECKIVTFLPGEDLSRVAESAFQAGAGQIGNYYDCAFFCHGIGTFCGGEGTRPSIGRPCEHEVTEELRFEVIAPRGRVGDVVSAIRASHSYEEPAIDIHPLEDFPPGCGMGRVGRLSRPAAMTTLINRVKKATGVKKVWIASPRRSGSSKPKPVSIAACAAGSAGSLFRKAAAAGAELYLTGEMRHHDALEAVASGMTVVCLGHSHSERITLKSLAGRLKKLLPKLAVVQSKKDADPFEIA